MTTINDQHTAIMFEEILEHLRKNASLLKALKQYRTDLDTDTASNSQELIELKTILEGNKVKYDEKLKELKKLMQKEKKQIEFTPTSLYGMLFSSVLIAIILALSVWIFSLNKEVHTLSDNDLQYRFIRMYGKANKSDIAKIDSIFNVNRDGKKIQQLRKQVETYEQLVKEQAEKIERAKLNTLQAEELQKRVEAVKIEK